MWRVAIGRGMRCAVGGQRQLHGRGAARISGCRSRERKRQSAGNDSDKKGGDERKGDPRMAIAHALPFFAVARPRFKMSSSNTDDVVG